MKLIYYMNKMNNTAQWHFIHFKEYYLIFKVIEEKTKLLKLAKGNLKEVAD